jgi:hypothetical protein
MSKQWGHGYKTGYADAIKDNGSIVGMFFHSYENNAICWQGQILRELKDGSFLVQLYSWINGCPTDQKIVSMSDIKDWSFYSSDEEMRYAYCRANGLDPIETERLEKAMFA